MNKTTTSFPNIFEYDNYRTFLKDAYAAMKAKDKKFSFRYFAKEAGFNSHNFLRLIIQGKSNISLASAAKIAKVFKFNQEETQFFKNLVLLNQSSSNEERQAHAKEILRSRTYRKIHPLNESKYQFFAHWYVSAVRELVALPGFKDDPVWIAKHVVPEIKPSEAKKAVDELIKLGLLKRDESGRLVQDQGVLTTPSEVSSAYVANWHKQYLQKASESIDSIPREKRDISAVSFGFSKKNIKIIKEMIANFRKEIIQIASEQDEKDILLQFNIQIFPLAEIDHEGDQ